MQKFPSIEQFRNVIRHVRSRAQYVGRDEAGEAIFDQSKPIPTLKFLGTVKIHGTNAGIVHDYATSETTYQSRERELSLTQDNAGFMLAQMENEDRWRKYFEEYASLSPQLIKIAVFGEWCGRGIQKGVAVSELEKMFVVFATKFIFADGSARWAEQLAYSTGEFSDIPGVHSIEDFPMYTVDIDFNFPELAQNKMVEITEEVERECPVGKAFGVSGIGEGVVWRCVDPSWNDSGTWFKVKGEKHSVSKVKKLAAVDVEAAATIKEFVERTVTEARLEQGFDNLVREQLKPAEMSSMGDFIRWVFDDVLKEEQDTIVASGIDPKKLGGPIANAARPWFVKKIDSLI